MNHRTVLRLKRLRWLELQVKKHKENGFRAGSASRLFRAVRFEEAVATAFSSIAAAEITAFRI